MDVSVVRRQDFGVSADVMGEAGGEFRDAFQDLSHGGVIRYEFPQRLVNAGDGGKSLGQERIPFGREAEGVVGVNALAALGQTAQALERFLNVEGAVIVGNFVARGDVTDGYFEVEAGTEARGGAGMIHEAAMIPTEDALVAPVHVRVAVRLPLQQGRKAIEQGGRDDSIELIASPGDGAHGDGARSEESIADGWAYEPEFGIWMDQAFHANAAHAEYPGRLR